MNVPRNNPYRNINPDESVNMSKTEIWDRSKRLGNQLLTRALNERLYI